MKLIKEIFIGKKILQPLFERMYRMSLRGMNYGLGGMISSSGEIELAKFVKNQLDSLGIKRKIIFDVGANNGDYTMMLQDIFCEEDSFFCFEPSRKCFEHMINRIGNRTHIELVNIGFGEVSETRKLYFDKDGSGWASLFPREETNFNAGLNEFEEVSLDRLDTFCSKHSIKRINFLKADVEGFELEVLKGAGKMLSNIDFIQFEFSLANQGSKTYLFDFFRYLSEFKIYRVLQDGIQAIDYNPQYEIFMTTNYLAINNKIAQKIAFS